MRNVFIQQITNSELDWIGQQAFAHLLKSAGAFHGDAACQLERGAGYENKGQNFHYKAFRNWKIRVGRRDVQRVQQRERTTPEVIVQKMRDPRNVFFHAR